MKHWFFLVIPLFCWVTRPGAAPPENSSISSIKLSLDSAIQIGLKNNPELKSSTAKIQAARGRFWSGISPSSPEVSASYDNIPVSQNISKFGENVVGINQPIDFPTNYLLRGSKYIKEAKISKQEYALVKIDVVSSIKSSYFKVLAHQNQMEIAKENLQIAQEFLKKAEIRHTVGDGTNLEKLTARVQYTEALNNYQTQQNHFATSLTELNFAMGNGKPTNREYELTDSLGFSLPGLSLEKVLDQAEGNNPTINLGKLQVGVCTIERSLAYSSLLPDFNIGVYSKNVTDDTQRYYGVSLSATIPLWFMLDQHGKIREASANVNSAKADLKRSENSLHLQIKCAFNEYQDAQRQVVSYHSEILPQAEEVYRSASKSYESGEITYMEFLEAKKTLISARSSYTEALLGYNLSIVTLEQSIGKTIQ